MTEKQLRHWTPIAEVYNPLEAGSIDGTDTEPHDHAVCRALIAKYQPDPHIKSKAAYTLFVARLNIKTTEDTLKQVFSQYGRIRQCKLVKDIVSGFSKGYAFIEYDTRSSVALACKATQMEIEGRKIFVDRERQRRLSGWVPRRLGGGFGGDKKSGQLRFGGKDRPFRKPISLTKSQLQ